MSWSRPQRLPPQRRLRLGRGAEARCPVRLGAVLAQPRLDVHVDDRQPAHRAGGHADVRIRLIGPPLHDLPDVPRGILEAALRQRPLATRAQREYGPADLEVCERRLDSLTNVKRPSRAIARARPRDPQTDQARTVLLELFAEHPTRVFYNRQIELLLERRFFRWITTRALGELVREGKIASEIRELRPGLVIRLCWSPKYRYPRRAAAAVATLILEYSNDRVGRALGIHGEMMFDAALPKVRFLPRAEKVREFAGRRWTETDHDLDRVFERDGVPYGTEIKNTLDYIELKELRVKLAMCAALGLRPLFIMRFAPKSYIEMINRVGGFALLFEYQMYPSALDELAKRLKNEFELKVGWYTQVATGTTQRFLKWHLEQLAARGDV